MKLREFQEHLDELLKRAIYDQGEIALESYDDQIDLSMRQHHGEKRLNEMSNVDFIRTLIYTYAEEE